MNFYNNFHDLFGHSYWDLDLDFAKELLLYFVADNSTFLFLVFSDNIVWGSLILEIDGGEIKKTSSVEIERYYQVVRDYRLQDWRKDYKGLLDLLKTHLSKSVINGLFMSRETFCSIINSGNRLYNLVEAISCNDIITEPLDLLERTLYGKTS